MLVPAEDLEAFSEDLDTLRRRMTPIAGRANLVCVLSLDRCLFPVTDEAAAPRIDDSTGQHACLPVQALGLKFEIATGMSLRGPDPRITWIVDFMQRHMSEPLTIAMLAEHVNLSRSRFTALFAAQTGVAPMRYLQRARLRRARLLVDRTFLSVKEIMTAVGYSDPSHFARDFRREHGMAPTAMRSEELTASLPPTPSDDPPRKRRIGPPRARDPGWVST